MVAWDPVHAPRGFVSIQNMPAPAAGHDYQLWVLDPTAPAPISAGAAPDSLGNAGFRGEVGQIGRPWLYLPFHSNRPGGVLADGEPFFLLSLRGSKS